MISIWKQAVTTRANDLFSSGKMVPAINDPQIDDAQTVISKYFCDFWTYAIIE